MMAQAAPARITPSATIAMRLPCPGLRGSVSSKVDVIIAHTSYFTGGTKDG
jgi:hypothetical protein